MTVTIGGARDQAPRWLDLPGFSDLRLKVRSLTTETVYLANIKADRQLAALVDQRAQLAEIGGDLSSLPNLDDPDEAAAWRSVRFIVALGQAAILDWEGVMGPDGGKAPISDEGVAELMRTYPVGVRFRDAYLAEHLARSAEKNASAPSPDGISETAPNGADTAAPKGPSAGAKGAEPAHTSASGPKPPPG